MKIPADLDAEESVLAGAIVDHEVRKEVLDRCDEQTFTDPRNRTTLRAIRQIVERGDEVTPSGLKREIAALVHKDSDVDIRAFVAVLTNESHTTPSMALSDLKGLLALQEKRDMIEISQKLLKGAQNGRHRAAIEQVRFELGTIVRHDEVDAASDVFRFIGEREDPPDWVVTDLLERGDRLIFTGREGSGKSTLLHQWGVQIASGIHPFTIEEMPPARVLIVDLENPKAILRRRLRPLTISVKGSLQPDRLFVESRIEGLDLSHGDDRSWLDRKISSCSPDVVIAGPLYKLGGGNPNDEVDMKPVALYLDQLRAEHHFALILEAHSRHDDKIGIPFGWSGWRRWPEIGLNLTQQGVLREWRPARHPISFPSVMQRGGEWPWTPTTNVRDQDWMKILDHCADLFERPSIRDLADQLSIDKNRVERALKKHQAEWTARWSE